MSSRIEEAFAIINRADFLPLPVKDSAWIDAPVPIGYGQTNSQPTTVRLMLEWLDPAPGDRVLDVGSGSGWTSALLARLTSPDGEVYAVEKIPELVEMGRQNCARAGLDNVRFFQAGEKLGLPAHAPYDRILVSAAATALPDVLLEQLKPGGKMVIPIENDIFEITKGRRGRNLHTRHPGFIFVPLIED